VAYIKHLLVLSAVDFTKGTTYDSILDNLTAVFIGREKMKDILLLILLVCLVGWIIIFLENVIVLLVILLTIILILLLI
jgi:hypothetical protein